MTSTELVQRFADSFRLHDIGADYESDHFQGMRNARDAFEAATEILEAQAAARIIRDVECLLNAKGPGDEILEREESIGLLLALFIVAREEAGDVQIQNGDVVVSDQMTDMSNLYIEVGARRSDFLIDFVLRWHEYGPHPDWYPGADETVPSSLDVTNELALIRDQPTADAGAPSDRKTKRGGLKSLGLLVITYEDKEAARDPFGLAKRAVADVQQAAFEDFIP